MHTRRQFLKYSAGAMSALVVGKAMSEIFEDEAFAAVQTKTVSLTITDCLKDMATHNTLNSAQCYYWCYVDTHGRVTPDVPGPHIFVREGDTVNVKVHNHLDEPHSFFIRGVVNSKPIPPGKNKIITFKAPKAGTYMYFDRLNAPVNRVMGLHGAFVSMPRKAPKGNKFSPYGDPTPNVQKLFNDFGSQPWWPGLSWQKGDSATATARFRQYIWILHQASPNLFAEVGDFTPGQDFDRTLFVNKFLRDSFAINSNENLGPTNNVPQYFTISGQSGHFSHNSPYLCPNNRVGEPVLIRLLNAGLWTHSMHIHANHVYITYANGVTGMPNGVQENPFWVDVFTLDPMSIVAYTLPYMRPPDIPNVRGIGRADAALISAGSTLGSHPVWPPNEELNTFLPRVGDVVTSLGDMAVQLSPLCYPMHDHSEPSQTAQGGNYNMGMISGINFTGDRNTPGAMNFPNQPLYHGVPHQSGLHPCAVGPPWMSEG
jgi:hypothetical protein